MPGLSPRLGELASGCLIEPWARKPSPAAVPVPAFIPIGDTKSQNRFRESPAHSSATHSELANPEYTHFKCACSHRDPGLPLSTTGGGLCERDHKGRAQLPAAPAVSPALVEHSPRSWHWGETAHTHVLPTLFSTRQGPSRFSLLTGPSFSRNVLPV